MALFLLLSIFFHFNSFAQTEKWSDDPPVPFQDSCHWELSVNLAITTTAKEMPGELEPNLGGQMGFFRLMFKFYKNFHFYGQYGVSTSKVQERSVAWTHWSSGVQLDFSYQMIHPYLFLGFGLMQLENPYPIKKDQNLILIEPWKSGLLHYGFGLNILSAKGLGVKTEASLFLMNYPGYPQIGNGDQENLYQIIFNMGLVKRF